MIISLEDMVALMTITDPNDPAVLPPDGTVLSIQTSPFFQIGSLGGHGVLMPYRASFPLYGLCAYYNSPGSVTRTVDATHVTYAKAQDGTVRVFGGGQGSKNLGDKAGVWSLYTASVTYTITAGYGQTETYGLTIAGVTTNYPLDVMGLTRTAIATTFPYDGAHSAQVPFATSGPTCAVRHPLVSPQAHVDNTVPNGEFSAYAASTDSDGRATVSGTIRQDSAGNVAYSLFNSGVFGHEVRFICGGVYDVSAASFDESIHPMIVSPILSLTRG